MEVCALGQLWIIGRSSFEFCCLSGWEAVVQAVLLNSEASRSWARWQCCLPGLSHCWPRPGGDYSPSEKKNTKLGVERVHNKYIDWRLQTLSQVAGCMASKFRNAGQTCVSTNRFSISEIQLTLLLCEYFSDFLFAFRVLVHEAVHDAFVAKIKVRPSKCSLNPSSFGIYCFQSIHDCQTQTDIRLRIQAAVEAQQILGDGMEAGVTQGPLINKSQHR